jgi:hypothetical protein
MTYDGLGEVFEGDSAVTPVGKFLLTSMGSGGEGLACADPGAKTPIGVSGNLIFPSFFLLLVTVTKIPEGVVVEFRNFTRALNSQKYKDSNNKNYLGTPPSRTRTYLEHGVFGYDF